jgi:DNA-binding response OmpR family regulator
MSILTFSNDLIFAFCISRWANQHCYESENANSLSSLHEILRRKKITLLIIDSNTFLNKTFNFSKHVYREKYEMDICFFNLNNKTINLYQYKEKSNTPQIQIDSLKLINQNSSEISLLKLFIKNKNKQIDIEYISKSLWEEITEAHIKTIYSYIHNLKKTLSQCMPSIILLESMGKGKYILKMKEN